MIKYKDEEVSTEEYIELRLQDFFQDLIDELNYDYDIDEEKAEKLVKKAFDNYVWF